MTNRFDEIEKQTVEMARERRAAHAAAVGAIRDITYAVRQALHGEALRGLPNLSSYSTSPYRGVLVRCKHGAWDRGLPRPRRGEQWGRPALVYQMDGHLALARQDRAGDINVRPILDEELRAEDAELVAGAVSHALDLHLSHVERRTRRYAEMRRISETIRTALAKEA